MSAEDFEVFKDMRRARQVKRDKQLAAADDTGWSKHTVHHWYRMVGGRKLEFWPSSNKYRYLNKMYRGALPRFIKEMMEAENG